MKSFYFDSEESVFGIKDEEKFRILKYDVYKCTIIGNKAMVYTLNGITTYTLNLDGTYIVEAIN